jgi:hypothetical protein
MRVAVRLAEQGGAAIPGGLSERSGAAAAASAARVDTPVSPHHADHWRRRARSSPQQRRL